VVGGKYEYTISAKHYILVVHLNDHNFNSQLRVLPVMGGKYKYTKNAKSHLDIS